MAMYGNKKVDKLFNSGGIRNFNTLDLIILAFASLDQAGYTKYLDRIARMIGFEGEMFGDVEDVEIIDDIEGEDL